MGILGWFSVPFSRSAVTTARLRQIPTATTKGSAVPRSLNAFVRRGKRCNTLEASTWTSTSSPTMRPCCRFFTHRCNSSSFLLSSYNTSSGAHMLPWSIRPDILDQNVGNTSIGYSSFHELMNVLVSMQYTTPGRRPASAWRVRRSELFRRLLDASLEGQANPKHC